LQYEQRHRLEALRLRDQEERQLKKAGNKRYREIAEQHYRVFMICRTKLSVLDHRIDDVQHWE